jgi:hypothetical protein
MVSGFSNNNFLQICDGMVRSEAIAGNEYQAFFD